MRSKIVGGGNGDAEQPFRRTEKASAAGREGQRRAELNPHHCSVGLFGHRFIPGR
jgi:hypothetical protein